MRNCHIDPETIEYRYMTKGNKNYVIVTSDELQEKFNLTLGSFRLEICPLKIITDLTRHYMSQYILCDKFHCFPISGGLDVQDNKTIQAFELIMYENNRIQNEDMKK